jgi:hypothetical protein
MKAKRNEINEQGKEKKPMNEMINEHVDHSKTIREFINFLKQRLFCVGLLIFSI